MDQDKDRNLFSQMSSRYLDVLQKHQSVVLFYSASNRVLMGITSATFNNRHCHKAALQKYVNSSYTFKGLKYIPNERD